jgi:hypothetical protein
MTPEKVKQEKGFPEEEKIPNRLVVSLSFDFAL